MRAAVDQPHHRGGGHVPLVEPSNLRLLDPTRCDERANTVLCHRAVLDREPGQPLEVRRLRESPIGTVYAAWRGTFVVFGARKHVVAAIAEHDPSIASRWAKLLPTKPTEMSMGSIDGRYHVLMGEDVADWSFTLDKLTKEPLFLGGAISIRYKTPAAATKALADIKDWSSRGKFPAQIAADPDIVAAFDGFAAAIGKLDPKVTGNELLLTFDSDRLGGPAFVAGVAMHFDKLQGKLTPR